MITCPICKKEFIPKYSHQNCCSKNCSKIRTKEKHEKYIKIYSTIIKEYNQLYCQKNRKRIKEYRKEYNKTHKKELKESLKKYRQNHKIEAKEYRKKYYQEHKEQMKEYRKNYCREYRETIKEQIKNYRQTHKKEIEEYQKKYLQKNREEIKKTKRNWNLKNRNKRNQQLRDRRKIDIHFKILDNLRRRVRQALKGQIKSERTMDLLGCQIDFLKQYLKSLFKPNMSWSNYGKWQIDHIHPCASFDLTKSEEQRKCFHYTNLQPLWAEENLRKQDKII